MDMNVLSCGEEKSKKVFKNTPLVPRKNGSGLSRGFFMLFARANLTPHHKLHKELDYFYVSSALFPCAHS